MKYTTTTGSGIRVCGQGRYTNYGSFSSRETFCNKWLGLTFTILVVLFKYLDSFLAFIIRFLSFLYLEAIGFFFSEFGVALAKWRLTTGTYLFLLPNGLMVLSVLINQLLDDAAQEPDLRGNLSQPLR